MRNCLLAVGKLLHDKAWFKLQKQPEDFIFNPKSLTTKRHVHFQTSGK